MKDDFARDLVKCVYNQTGATSYTQAESPAQTMHLALASNGMVGKARGPTLDGAVGKSTTLPVHAPLGLKVRMLRTEVIEALLCTDVYHGALRRVWQ